MSPILFYTACAGTQRKRDLFQKVSQWRIQCPENLSDIMRQVLPKDETGHNNPLSGASGIPDILITSGFRELRTHFCKHSGIAGTLFDYLHYPVPGQYAMFYQPFANLVGTFATDAMVIVADKFRFGTQKLPSEWYELLHPGLKRSIIYSSSEEHYYDAFFYPYAKIGGDSAIRQLAGNLIGGESPQQMVLSINNVQVTDALLYVMPYSYAHKIKNTNYKIIWPTDGFIPVPIHILVKKGKLATYRQWIDHLYSEQFASKLTQAGFITPQSGVLPCKTDWMKWDFIHDDKLPDFINQDSEFPD
jgi:hypothetical protein